MSRPKLDLSGTQVVAGVLATTTAAIAASKLGTAGTLLGAAITSVVSTAGGAVYKHYLDQSKERVVSVIGTSPGRSAEATSIIPASPPEETRLDLVLDPSRLDPAHLDATRLDLPPARPPARRTAASWWRGRWALYLGLAAAVFVLVMGGITVAERVMGNSLSGVVNNEQAKSGTWGGGFDKGEPEKKDPSPAPTTGEPTTDPTVTPEPTAPATTAPPTTPPATPAPEPSTPDGQDPAPGTTPSPQKSPALQDAPVTVTPAP
ncbi:hypothetical protein [Actinocorallia longicatena]|uniref:Uncharacterized protein n=1 Tax=Actinocorallia longicatena TaxID=111803 RepID=A0ABP6QCR9_9ACTN